MSPKNISINDYTYQLPEDRIANHPLPERDASKLLIYDAGIISESIYKNIVDHIAPESLLIFNNTKVIRARVRFYKPTGGMIEIFCLEPFEAIKEYQSVMSRTESVRWKCMIGGAGKWKEGALTKTITINDTEVTLSVRLIEKLTDAYVAAFCWQPTVFSFAEIIAAAGDIPLPPYIKRETASADSERYQTIYAKDEGSVAAPTAGLHFTPHIMAQMSAKNIQHDFVTLHVGAGTFKPVKADLMQDHEMHAEWIDVSVSMIKNLLQNIDRKIIAVGTTSLRTIESLYWMGVKAFINPAAENMTILQWEVYDELQDVNLSATAALEALIQWLQKKNLDQLFTQTQILIAPGYQFKIAKALITNFHQPKSTLLLLVAAAVGEDWRKFP